jgi:integrase
MKATLSRKSKREQPAWPKLVQPGRAIVRVYRRKTPGGNYSFMVANYADGQARRFDCYPGEGAALEAADLLARRLDRRDYVAASMTQGQALEYANSAARLKPLNITVDAATSALAAVVGTGAGMVPDLAALHAAVKFFCARNKLVTAKPVAEVVAEFLAVKAARGSSPRYLRDLTGRLSRFASDFKTDASAVTTAELQTWLDGLKLSPRSYQNYRTVLNTFFQFGVARGYCADNLAGGAEKLKIRSGDIEIFTVGEIGRLLEACRAEFPEFLPCLAVGAFAGLRSAELERLEWKDIDLAARHIVVGASKSKTASRRIVPISDNLAEWLRPYSGRQGKLWRGRSGAFYESQQDVCGATPVPADEAKGIKAQPAVVWKQNGLRHSYASYRFGLIQDAPRVSAEMGNSAQVVFKHYRALVTPEEAKAWFDVKPAGAAVNVLPMPLAATA